MLSWSYYLLVEFKCLQMWFLCLASCTDKAIHACSIKMGLGTITVCQTTLPTLQVIKKHFKAEMNSYVGMTIVKKEQGQDD